MKHINAVRTSGDVYQCTYSDSKGQDTLSWSAIERVARAWGYTEVRVDQRRYHGEDEPPETIVRIKQ